MFSKWKKSQISLTNVLRNRFGLAYSLRYKSYHLQSESSKYYKIIIPFEELYATFIESLRVHRGIRLVDSLSAYDKIMAEYPLYRGHTSYSYRIVPSLFREATYKNHEVEMYQTFVDTCPDETKNKTDYEILSLMQHYGLPTRLLDITTDKYVALFMACSTVFGNSNSINDIGEVVAFKNIKTVSYNSKSVNDTIFSILHPCDEVPEIKIINGEPLFIKYHKFEDNKRLAKQKGTFILMRDEEYPESLCDLVYIINKKGILKELSDKNYNEKELVPELEHKCHFIKKQYSLGNQ